MYNWGKKQEDDYEKEYFGEEEYFRDEDYEAGHLVEEEYERPCDKKRSIAATILAVVMNIFSGFLGIVMLALIVVAIFVFVLCKDLFGKEGIHIEDTSHQEVVVSEVDVPVSSERLVTSATTSEEPPLVIEDLSEFNEEPISVKYANLIVALESGKSPEGFNVSEVRFRGIDNKVYYWSDLISRIDFVDMSVFRKLTPASKKCFYFAQLTLALSAYKDFSSDLEEFWYNEHIEYFMMFNKLLTKEDYDVIMAYYYPLESDSVFEEEFIPDGESEFIQERLTEGVYTGFPRGSVNLAVKSGTGSISWIGSDGIRVDAEWSEDKSGIIQEFATYNIDEGVTLTVSGSLEVIMTYF